MASCPLLEPWLLVRPGSFRSEPVGITVVCLSCARKAASKPHLSERPNKVNQEVQQPGVQRYPELTSGQSHTVVHGDPL